MFHYITGKKHCVSYDCLKWRSSTLLIKFSTTLFSPKWLSDALSANMILIYPKVFLCNHLKMHLRPVCAERAGWNEPEPTCISCLRLCESYRRAIKPVCLSALWLLWDEPCGVGKPQGRGLEGEKGICWLKADLWHAHNSLLIQLTISFCFLPLDFAVTHSLNQSHVHCHGLTGTHGLIYWSVIWQ